MKTATDLGALFDHLTAAEAVALLARLPAPRRHEVLAGPLPAAAKVRGEVVRWVVESGDADDCRALLGGFAPGAAALEALAGAADPAVRVAVYLHPDAPAALRRSMLAGGPGALAVPGELRDVLLGTRSRHLLGPAWDAADPAVAAHAARHVHGPRRQPPPQAPEDVYAWLRIALPSANGSPEAHGREPVSRRVPRERRVRARLAAVAFEAWTAADWDTLARLHGDAPLDPVTARFLIGHPSCPAAAGSALLRSDTRVGQAQKVVAGLRAGTFGPAHLYTRVTHAPAVLAVLESPWLWQVVGEIPGLREAHAALRDAVRAELGDDAGRWRSLLALLRGDFPGTIPELLCEAASTAPPERLPAHPGSGAVDGAGVRTGVGAEAGAEAGGSPWAFLLLLAEPARLPSIIASVAAAEPGWGGCVTEEILRLGKGVRLPGPLVDGFAAVADEPARVKFARQRGGDPETATRLVELDDPVVNAALLATHRLPPRIFRRVLSGTAHATGRAGTLRLHPSTFRDARGQYQPRFAPKYLVHSCDPDRIAELLRSTTAFCAAYQAAGCRRLVELGRLDLVADFVTAPGGPRVARPHTVLVEALAESLAADDSDAAHDALRALSGRLFLADLGTPNLGDLGCHLEIEPALDWAAVAESRRGKPYPRGVARILAQADDLPKDIALALLAADPDGCAPTLAARSPALAHAALDAASPAARRNGYGPAFQDPAWWPEQCLREGLFTVEDLITRGRPIGAVLQLCRRRPTTTRGADTHVRNLIDRHGPLPVDAWAVLAMLMEDFTGTLPELIATAEAAAAPG
ncbi:hypothetical protein [Embleya sp. NBC_00896]|uniref:hypothetical protein n=1 Tax=Embleya sp. NBC_00896 TaxID=2975961 RepID=UPI003866E283|nr:hypothetical protein OG928_31465 [Embleya sp. NBC_00896]